MKKKEIKDKTLSCYFNEIARYPALSREEERSLAIKAKAGDKKAKEMLINSNLRFVVKIAMNYRNRGMCLGELISEGNLGLIRAIEKFEPQKENKLISYAVWWIKQRILFALAEKSTLIRMPVGLSQCAAKLRLARERILVEQGHPPDLHQLSKETDISAKVIKQVSETMTESLSIDEMSHKGGNDEALYYDMLECQSASDPHVVVENEKLYEHIKKTVKSLDKREAYIINSYFGLNGFDEKNFAQIAKQVGMSRERVRQIQKNAMEKIFQKLYSVKENQIDNIMSRMR